MSRHANEDRIIGGIDRQNGKVGASARILQLREIAKAETNCAVKSQNPEEQAEYMGAAIRHLRTLYGETAGEVSAVALFGSLAWSPAIQTRQVVAQARAEQLFAANDGDEA